MRRYQSPGLANANKGQALIIVISVLSLLFIVGIAIYVLSQAEQVASIRHLDSLRARYAAEAGVAYAQKLLKLDRQTNLLDSLEDANFKAFTGEDIDVDGDGQVEGRWFNIEDNDGNAIERFAVKLSDEAGKLNLNTCKLETLQGLFSQLGLDSSKADALFSGGPYNVVEEIGPVLGKAEFAKAKDCLTVYSYDLEKDLDRKRRVYLNSSSAQVMLEAMQAAGIKDAQQKAAILKDASDADLGQTLLDTFSISNLFPTSLETAGSWQKTSNYYEAPAGGISGKFSWSNLPIEDGNYYCFVYGPQSDDVVGEVNGQYAFSGEGLAEEVKVEGAGLSLMIKPAPDKASRFSYIELESSVAKQGLSRKTVSGTEALVINELMVKPSKEFKIDPIIISPTDGIRHSFDLIAPGKYYLIVFAKDRGGQIGNVTIDGRTATNLYDSDFFPEIINTSGSITVEVKNNSLKETSFGGIKISQQPDAEWIELLNLSPKQIDLSDFTFEAYSLEHELISGWPAHIPEGAKIQPYQHMVFALDNADVSPAPRHILGNGISFQGIWGFSGVGLIFDEYADAIDKSFDPLPDKGGIVFLKDAQGRRVDGIKYQALQLVDFVSLERPDPSAKIYYNRDGLFDGWFNSESNTGATAASVNENAGMYTQEGSSRIKHSPSEVVVFNRPLSGLSEITRLSSGESWKKFNIPDISKMADKFSSLAVELVLSGTTELLSKGQLGEWEFSDIPAGSYLLSIVSENLSAEGDKIQVSYKTDKEQVFTNFSSPLFAQGIAFFGEVILPQNSTIFGLKIISDSERKISLKAIILEPVYSVQGRININSAKKEVLNSLLGPELANIAIKERPIGNKNNRKLGIGDLFLLDSNFVSFHNNLTVKSDVYAIISRGESSRLNQTQANQTIYSVVDRGE